MKIKSKLLAIMIFLAMVFTLMPMTGIPAYAKGDKPYVVKSGTLDNFTKDAPITTVRLDASKFTRLSASLYSENDYYDWGSGEAPQKADGVWALGVDVPKTKNDNGAIEGNEISLPSFSIELSDAAIMRDGTRKALKITFDNIKVFTKSGMDQYTDSFQIVRLSDNENAPGIDISPASDKQKQFGLQAKVTCEVVGAADDDTLLLVATEINNIRDGDDFRIIKGAEDNFSYSESIQFLSGIDSESDIYLAETININTAPEDTTNESGYTVRFVGNRDTNAGLAAAVSASGASANVWSSAGINPLHPLNMFLISPNSAPRNHTSSSGEGGRIELWTDGQTHQADSEAAAH